MRAKIKRYLQSRGLVTEHEVGRRNLYSLMTLPCVSQALSPSGCVFCFSKSMSTMSGVPSERAMLPGKVPAGDLMAPRSAIESRIEMRLLRVTRSVLEYLSNGKLDSPSMGRDKR